MVRDGHTLDESQTASHSSLQSQCKGFPSSWTEVSEATLENTVLFRPEETREKVSYLEETCEKAKTSFEETPQQKGFEETHEKVSSREG